MRIGIIGAGPAGMTAGYLLSRSGVEVEVFEASNFVGGMSRSFRLWDQTVDVGPHRFFSKDSRVNDLWKEVVGNDYKMVDRMTRIYYKNQFFNYPLKPLDALTKLGLIESSRCLLSYLKQKCSVSRQTPSETFESWVTDRFGKRLYEIFFKTYSEKLWGITCDELDSDFAAQRIKNFSLFQAILSFFDFLKSSNGKHATLVDRFAYPTGGTGMVYERMAQFVDLHGQVNLGSPIQGVVTNDRRVTGLELFDGTRRQFDHVISTMPLTHLVKSLPDASESVSQAVDSLKFRNTIVVYLNVAKANLFRDQWLYIHDSSLRVGRITNFRNWAPEICAGSGNTIVALEYWCNADDKFWNQPDDDIVQLAAEEFVQTGLLRDSSLILEGKALRVPKCYPVYQTGYKAKLDVIVNFVKRFEGLSAIGRYGAFKYNNQDHSILMGILAAENLLSNQRHDLWQVNTDYGEYQEDASSAPIEKQQCLAEPIVEPANI